MSLKQHLYPYYFRYYILGKIARSQYQRIKNIRGEGVAKVVFIVSSLSMWRSQKLYEMMAADSRFLPNIVIYPFPGFVDSEKEKSVQSLTDYFITIDVPFIDLSKEKSPGLFIKNHLDPDIIFYPQPYNWLYKCDLDNVFFEDRLLAYVPYSTNTIDEAWIWNQRFCNVAWRLYYSTEEDKANAERISLNKGRNVKVAGNAAADTFLSGEYKSPWKDTGSRKKRIIWAPHYSITNGGPLYRSSFLSLNSVMSEIADRYQSELQFAFKPHPRLATELYKHPEWGKERTDAYYSRWATGPNTQLETGSYIDLFMTSDAMIHDSVSFTAEYHFSLKPAMFTTSDVERDKKQLNALGRKAIDAHYLGSSSQDIITFIENVVLVGDDPMLKKRSEFFRQYLLPPGGASVAGTIYHDIVESIWG